MAHSRAIVCQNYLFFLQEVVRFNCLHTDNGFFWVCSGKAAILPWVDCLVGVFHQFLLVSVPAFVLWNPRVLQCYTHPEPLKTQSRKSVAEHGFLSLWSPPGVYASRKKCHCELVGKEKWIPNLYSTHLFSGDNLVSSFNKKIETNGWKILHHLSSQNSLLSWLILMSSSHLREGSKD